MRFVLGFDGGGTKTDCMLMDEALVVRAHSSPEPEVQQRLRLAHRRFSLVRTGGMIGHSKFSDAQPDARLRETAPHAEFGELELAPAEAVARRALRLLSEPVPSGE